VAKITNWNRKFTIPVEKLNNLTWRKDIILESQINSDSNYMRRRKNTHTKVELLDTKDLNFLHRSDETNIRGQINAF